MSKRVLCTIDTCGSGGAETIYLQLLKRLDREVYSPYVVMKGKGWLYDEVVKLGLQPEIVRMEGSFNMSYLLHIIRIIKQNKIDLIHSHLFGSNLYCSIAGLLQRIPVISTFHGTVDSNPNGRMVRLKFGFINSGSKYIVFVSNYLKEYYLQHTAVSRKKSLTIYNGIDCNRFSVSRDRGLRSEWGYSDNDFVIGSIGNIRHSKGYEVLLRAASIVIKRYPQCKFVIAGDGHGDLYQAILAMRENLGLGRVVQFLGFRPDVENVLSSLDLFVLPSITEGFSLSTIEAMAAGLAVVVTDSGGPGEIVKHSENGIIVIPNSPEALAEGIQRCISDDGLRRHIGANALQEVRSKFSIESMTKAYIRLYDEAILKSDGPLAQFIHL